MEDYEVIAEYEGYTVQEAKLTYAARQKLSADAFCGPNRTYPAHDASHVRSGLQRLSQFGHRLKPAVRARIHGCLVRRAKRFGVQVSETSNIDPIVAWYLEEKGLGKK